MEVEQVGPNARDTQKLTHRLSYGSPSRREFLCVMGMAAKHQRPTGKHGGDEPLTMMCVFCGLARDVFSVLPLCLLLSMTFLLHDDVHSAYCFRAPLSPP